MSGSQTKQHAFLATFAYRHCFATIKTYFRAERSRSLLNTCEFVFVEHVAFWNTTAVFFM